MQAILTNIGFIILTNTENILRWDLWARKMQENHGAPDVIRWAMTTTLLIFNSLRWENWSSWY